MLDCNKIGLDLLKLSEQGGSLSVSATLAQVIDPAGQFLDLLADFLVLQVPMLIEESDDLLPLQRLNGLRSDKKSFPFQAGEFGQYPLQGLVVVLPVGQDIDPTLELDGPGFLRVCAKFSPGCSPE